MANENKAESLRGLTRREFLDKLGTVSSLVGVPGRNLLSDGSKTPERQNPETNIIQTGLTEMDVAGNKYKITIDGESILDLIQEFGTRQYGAVNTDSAIEYLKTHELEIKIYERSAEPLLTLVTLDMTAGTFIPPDDIPYTPRALIMIPTDTLKKVYFPDQSSTTKKNDGGDIDYSIVLPHELLHFVSYAKSPIEAKVKSYIDRSVKIIEDIYAGIAALSEKKGGVLRFLRFAQVMIMANLLNMFVLIPVDPHEPNTDTFSTSHLTDIVDQTPQIKELVLKAINLTQE